MNTKRTIGALALAMAISAAASAGDALTRVAFSIEPQPIARALLDLGDQAGLQILIRREDVGSTRLTRPVDGKLTVRAALEQVLANSGLSYRFLDARTVLVQAAETHTDSAEARDSSAASNRAASESAASHGSQASGDDVLEEIVVTAQKKEESIQDVPISISAVTADELVAHNANRLADVAATIPGLQIDSQTGQPGSTNITLRGITTGSITSTTTATTIDDVPIGVSSSYAYAALNGTDLLPYDLDHIEVLRGPQGTLYGANSLGGLVKYVTPMPDLERMTFRIGGNISGTDHGGAQVGNAQRAEVNVPLVPGELAVNASIGRVYTPGYIENVVTGEKAYNDGKQEVARVTLLWKATESFSARLVAMYNHSDFDGLGTVLFDAQTAAPVLGYTRTSFIQAGDERKHKIGIATLDYRFGWADLTSVTGYSDSNGGSSYDVSPLIQAVGAPPFDQTLAPGFNSFQTKKFTQELRLASASGHPLQWMVGAFYTHEDTVYDEGLSALDQTTRQPNALNPLIDFHSPTTFKERAAFGNVTYAFNEQWDVSGGVRYSENDQSFFSTAAGLLQSGVVSPPDTSDSSTTYSLDARYHFAPDTMLYARFATGYRPGGTNGIVDASTPPDFGPDKLESYEVGLKSLLAERRWLVNLTGYYIDWTNMQVTQRTATNTAFTGNAGRALSRGVEFETSYAFTRELKMGLNGAYTDAQLRTDAPALGAASGDRLPYTPKFTTAVTGDWNHSTRSAYEVGASLAVRHVGERMSNFPQALPSAVRLPSYTVTDLSASYGRGPWRLSAFLKNATNEEAFLSAGTLGVAILAPRSYGLGFEYRQ